MIYEWSELGFLFAGAGVFFYFLMKGKFMEAELRDKGYVINWHGKLKKLKTKRRVK